MEITTVDFETEGIQVRPYYPPKPVGVAIKVGSGESRYFAWGHPTKNNCTYEEARAALAKEYERGVPLLFHNGKFDTDVAETHMGLPIPHWSLIHDTQFLVYLYDVHARVFALKPSAERILNWPPEERDRVAEWILANVPGASESRKSPNYWAAFICLAPGDLVGKYAIGDCDRTFGLFTFLYEYVEKNGMMEAYDRERRLMPHLMRAERHGIRTDWERLDSDYPRYQKAFDRADAKIRKILKAPELNINSGTELAQALLSSGQVQDLPRTPTGRYSTKRSVLESAVEDPTLLGLLKYRGVLKTALGTFMGPWVAQANANGGRIHTQWHQTRGDQDKGGTVTGRLSSIAPNFMNIPNDFKGCDIKGYPDLPHMRSYLLPEKGHVWLKRDYSAQEVRILGHFENGALMQAFSNDIRMDPHQYGADLIEAKTGFEFPRDFVKQVVFSILYGSGIAALAAKLGVPYHIAAQVKELYLNTFPDVRALMSDIKDRGRSRKHVRTLGGRMLYAEPPKGGRDFSYKLLNHLIQGSAGDATKEGLIRFCDQAHDEFHFLATVHDENNISAPLEMEHEAMELLRESMESVPCDVVLLSDAYRGTSWYDADNNKVAA